MQSTAKRTDSVVLPFNPDRPGNLTVLSVNQDYVADFSFLSRTCLDCPLPSKRPFPNWIDLVAADEKLSLLIVSSSARRLRFLPSRRFGLSPAGMLPLKGERDLRGERPVLPHVHHQGAPLG